MVLQKMSNYVGTVENKVIQDIILPGVPLGSQQGIGACPVGDGLSPYSMRTASRKYAVAIFHFILPLEPPFIIGLLILICQSFVSLAHPNMRPAVSFFRRISFQKFKRIRET